MVSFNPILRDQQGQGGIIPQAPNHCGRCRMAVGEWKSPNNVIKISSMQYIHFQKTTGLNLGAPNLLLASGAI